jgi:hypothetical protein
MASNTVSQLHNSIPSMYPGVGDSEAKKVDRGQIDALLSTCYDNASGVEKCLKDMRDSGDLDINQLLSLLARWTATIAQMFQKTHNDQQYVQISNFETRLRQLLDKRIEAHRDERDSVVIRAAFEIAGAVMQAGLSFIGMRAGAPGGAAEGIKSPGNAAAGQALGWQIGVGQAIHAMSSALGAIVGANKKLEADIKRTEADTEQTLIVVQQQADLDKISKIRRETSDHLKEVLEKLSQFKISLANATCPR